MKFIYRKNALKVKLYIPINEKQDKFIPFQVIFEKCRKKRTKGLYRLKFNLDQDIINKEEIFLF